MKDVTRKKMAKKVAKKKTATKNVIKVVWKMIKTGKKRDKFGANPNDYAVRQPIPAGGSGLVVAKPMDDKGNVKKNSAWHVFYNGEQISKRGVRDFAKATTMADKLLPPNCYRVTVTAPVTMTAADIEAKLK